MNPLAFLRQPVLFGLGLLLLFISLRVGAIASQPYTAKVVSLIGSARCTTNNAGWRELAVGQELGRGAIIQTEAGPSSVEISLAYRSRSSVHDSVCVLTNSVLRFDSPARGEVELEKPSLDLLAGQILGRLDRTSEHGLHGTSTKRLAVAVYESGTNDNRAVYVFDGMRLSVLLGALTVTTEQAGAVVTQVVRAGHWFGGGEIAPLAADAPERKLWR